MTRLSALAKLLAIMVVSTSIGAGAGSPCVAGSGEPDRAARVRAHTGFAIGGVAPVGSLQPLPVFCDADLLEHDYVWAAAGAPHAVFRVEPRALAEAAGATVAELAQREHPGESPPL